MDGSLCGLLVDHCDVFISCLDSHSDGTHSLQMIHDAELNSSKSVRMNKWTHDHLGWFDFHFCENFSFNIFFPLKNAFIIYVV